MCADRSLRDGSRTKAVPLASLTAPQRRLITALLEAASPVQRAADLFRDNKMDAAAKGARIGRPPVTSRPGFGARWDSVRAELARGAISRRQAARRLDIGTATLARLMGASSGSTPAGPPGRGRNRPQSAAGQRKRRRRMVEPRPAAAGRARSSGGATRPAAARPETAAVGSAIGAAAVPFTVTTEEGQRP